jgi:RNA polymerase sigma-70 factor, ECF subfamily
LNPSSSAEVLVVCPHLLTPGFGRETGVVRNFFGRLFVSHDGAKIDKPIRNAAAPAARREVAGMQEVSAGVTELLAAWSQGDRSALEKLLPFIERELHQIAHRQMSRERPGHTLQTTALVNEAYLRLVDQTRTQWRNRAHFFAVAAQIIRRILVNYARDRTAGKRGGGAPKLYLEDVAAVSDDRANELLALHDALEALARLDKRKGQIVELRYFGGLTVDEVADVLGLHPDTVIREWARAKAFLRRELMRG